ncbi:helix-turn-helix transcriptional regulator [bacterium]|nr:helix-turn-helix transcriptional regulator [bacterium]
MSLSQREHDVLLCIANGLVEKEIANKLKLAQGTVHSYVTSMKAKMNALTRAHAVAIYYREYPKWEKTKRKNKE